MGRPAIPLAVKLAKYTKRQPNGCLEWTGGRQAEGYGKTSYCKKMLLAHRVAYELAKGPIPPGLQIDHLCRNPACCDADHLEAVTGWENTLRTTNPLAEMSRRTHCPAGHAYDTENTRITPTGARVCRTCLRRRATERKRRIAAARRAAAAQAAGAN